MAATQRVRGAKACDIDHDIVRTFDAVACDDAMRADFGYSIRDEFDIRAIERGIVVVGNEHAFAAQLILRSERGAELWIFDPPSHVTVRNRLGLLANRVVTEKSENAEFLPPENVLPEGPAR